MILNKLNFKLFSFILIFIFFVYLFEYYLLNISDQYFVCVELIKNFNFFSIDSIVLPIHCDEGPYRYASINLETFFSKENPYQGRPLYIFLLYLIRSVGEFVLPNGFSEYLIFRISLVILQTIILFFITKLLTILLNLKLDKFIDYFYLILLLMIPNIRWNIFFPSHGSLTLLFLLLTLCVINKKIDLLQNRKNLYFIFGFLSLAHSSAIMYAFIIFIYDFLHDRKINLTSLLLLPFSQVIYEFSYRVAGYQSYDWGREVYNQFFWIFDVFQGKETRDCQQLDTFLRCSFEITLNYMGYFVLGLTFLSVLFISQKFNFFNKDKLINQLFVSCLVTYIFWSFMGYYESFRFVNYSIGYFMFLSFIFYIAEIEHYKYLIGVTILFYQISIKYLEPFELTFIDINFFNVTSSVLFLVYLYANNIKNKNSG
tara:strand:- start:231 stop:1511 length:1281 start_codon:yes stop_codon:yes gene_type:complete